LCSAEFGPEARSGSLRECRTGGQGLADLFHLWKALPCALAVVNGTDVAAGPGARDIAAGLIFATAAAADPGVWAGSPRGVMRLFGNGGAAAGGSAARHTARRRRRHGRHEAIAVTRAGATAGLCVG